MCLTACKVSSEKFVKANKGKTVTVYKVYNVDDTSRILMSPYQSYSGFKGTQISGPGEIISNRGATAKVIWKDSHTLVDYDKQGEPVYGPGASIEKGIHVFVDKKDASNLLKGFSLGKVVELEADVDDFLGLSSQNLSERSHAIFSKVTLTDAVWGKLFTLTEAEKAERRSEASRKAAATKKRKAAGRSAAAKKAARTRARNLKAKK